MDWQQIVLFIIGIILVALVVYVKHLSTLLKESGECLTVIGNALEDGTITKEEMTQIIKEANDVKAAFIELVLLIKKRKT